jgi:hypothetical protein
VGLDEEESIPEIDNPFDDLPEPTLGPAANLALPPIIT